MSLKDPCYWNDYSTWLFRDPGYYSELPFYCFTNPKDIDLISLRELGYFPVPVPTPGMWRASDFSF